MKIVKNAPLKFVLFNCYELVRGVIFLKKINNTLISLQHSSIH